MNTSPGMFGWMAQSMTYLAEWVGYMVHAVWVTAVKAAIGFLEAVDEFLPGLDVAHNALWRAVVMAVVGFFLGVGAMIFLSFITGNWGIPCVFTLAILFCAFVGLIADPGGDWSLGNLPTFGGGGNNTPQTPLNL
jgi:hypothetical protein